MKKTLISLVLLITACATKTPLLYDKTKINLSPDVKLEYIEENSYLREFDGHTLVTVSGVSAKDQTIYYKINWLNSYGGTIKTSLSSWKQKKLMKGMDFNIDGVSPSKKSQNYKVIITTNIGNGILK